MTVDRRRAGVCLHPTSLPGPHCIGGIGRAARQFLDWMAAHRLSVWQFLPLGPTGYGDSPYQPLSVFAGNPLMIDLADLVDWALLEPADIPAESPPGDRQVDFGRAAALKARPLALAAERLLRTGGRGLGAEYEAFCAAHDRIWLDNFAAFVVLKALNRGSAWGEWASARAGRTEVVGRIASRHRAAWEQAKCIQFLFARQWAALRLAARQRGILLFGDVPIYLALDCAEAWARPDLLELDKSLAPLELTGVPPDYFSADGQLWGNPVYRWEAHAAEGFAWWIARLRHALQLADLVRLDHFRGFDEYWSVPKGATTAREGHWKSGPGRELFDAVRRALGRAPFVAEDLGLITESVTALRRAFGFPGMQVLQFLVDQAEFDVDDIEEDCVCYTGTHDNDTTEGWFAGSEGRVAGAALTALQQGVVRNLPGARECAHKAMISLCFSTRARLAIVPLQDYLGLGSDSRLNTPGLPAGNWGWRVREAELDRGDLAYIGEQVLRFERI